MERRAGKTVSVSWSSAQGQYRRYVGFQLGRNGKPQPKCWYLGENDREAVRRAVEILAEWNRLTAARATAWLSQAAGGDTGGGTSVRRTTSSTAPPLLSEMSALCAGPCCEAEPPRRRTRGRRCRLESGKQKARSCQYRRASRAQNTRLRLEEPGFRPSGLS